MFCPKCGTKVLDGEDFCKKCGTKIVHMAKVQQSTDIPAPIAEPQQTSAAETTIAWDTQQPPAKANGNLHKTANIGRALKWGALVMLFLHLPINPAILVALVAVGIILSALGAKRPLGLSKIIELVVAVILLVIVVVSTLSSGGTGDKYVQMVKGGTLNGYPQMTVGEAFDSFLADPKWESGLSDDNIRFVNITGGILYYDKEAELIVQFIVDEKSQSFQYNACEIDGVPQNNLVFWGLLETIYNSSSSSKGVDSQNDPNFMSDKIIIGETQSYDNDFGNIEVTLDYVTFTDKLENTLLGGYIYPDEGNVFLWADITVKNIGTENGNLITAWNTVVYDGAYKFRSHSTVGVPLKSIAPLTAPTEGAIIFEVPSSVMESDKSLVLNINDSDGTAVLSYVIRSGDDTVSNNQTASTKEPVDLMAEAQKAYAEKVRELAFENGNLQFALIDLTGSDVPELVAELPGYYIRVFAWRDEDVVPLGEEYWPYGAGGNNGYEYLPGQNVIRNFNSDQAGAIVYESYYGINVANEVDGLPGKPELSMWYFRDTNGNGVLDAGEPISDEPTYYVGNTEVTADTYVSYRTPGDYEWISGDKSAEEILALLNQSVEYDLNSRYEETYGSFSNNAELSEDLRFVKNDDEYSTFTLHPDGTFFMEVNLFEGVGTLFGSYTMDEYSVRCYIETKSFGGFDGDDVTEFEMVFNEDRLVYVGASMGAVWNGSTFYMI